MQTPSVPSPKPARGKARAVKTEPRREAYATMQATLTRERAIQLRVEYARR